MHYQSSRHHIKAMATAIAAALSIGCGSALAIGVVTPPTAGVINRPLNLELTLLGDSIEPHEVEVLLANPEQHEILGISYPGWLPKLDFQVVQRNKINYIQVSSRQLLKEPIVNFVVDVKYQGAHLLKEIVLFLDPAEFSTASQLAQSQSIQSQSIQSQPIGSQSLSSVTLNTQTSPSVAQATLAGSSVSNTTPPPARSGQKYRVRRGDSLWDLAKSWNAPGLSLEQKMQHIFEQNTHAFIRGNRDLLKQGSVISWSSGFNEIPKMPPKSQPESNSRVAEVTPTQSIPREVTPLTAENADLSVDQALVTVYQELRKSQTLVESQLSYNQQLKARINQVESLLAAQSQAGQIKDRSNQPDSLNQSLIQPLALSADLTPSLNQPSAAENTAVVSDNAQIASTEPGDATPAESNPETTEPLFFSGFYTYLVAAVWLFLALLTTYFIMLQRSRRNARNFSISLDNKLQELESHHQGEQTHLPSVKDLAIPKHLSSDVQIQYLKSAADFYLRCKRYDLVKELVNTSLLQYSGNARIIRALGQIQRDTIKHLDSELHTDIVKKLDARKDHNGEAEFDFVEKDLESLDDNWLNNWNQKVS